VIVHAGLVACMDSRGWRGVLIEGPSGAGKSDLALRAMAAGWSLVADDRTLLWVSDGRLYGRAVPALSGLVEARGLGVVAEPARAFVGVDLVVACVVRPEEIERAPDFQARTLLGVVIPSVRLYATEVSALAKLTFALRHLGLRRQPAYQACRAGAPPLASAGGDP
jgi:serine kinase of HPr protein (carbohydrate metabolism regulator)